MPIDATENRMVRVRDGVRLRLRRWDPQVGVRSPPVWLHHGFISNADINWNLPGVVEALLESGRVVYAHDAIGHGRSETPHDPAMYGEERMAHDLWELADAEDVSFVDLVGYSMGAVVATLAASMRPERVRRLVLGGVGSGMVEVGGTDRRVLDPEQIAAAMTAPDVTELGASAGVGFRRFADTVGADRHALAAQARAMHRGGFDLARLTMPVRVLAGRADEMATRPEVLVDALPDASLVLVDGDHLGAVGRPEFAESLVDFLM